MPIWFKLAALTLQISIMAQVFALGLGTSWWDATYLFRCPRLLWKSVLARNVAVPVIAILLIAAFSLSGAIAITIGVLAVTPVPPLLPQSQLKSGARSEYALGLLVSQAVLAIVLVPASMELLNLVLGAHARFGVWQVAELVARTVLVPLAAGMVTARMWPRFKRFAPRLLGVGTAMLIVGVLPLLPIAWKAFATLAGNGAMLSLALFMLAGTAVGHFLGGPVAGDRTTLAIATSSRHPGLALAIAKANFPDQLALVAGAVLIYLIFRGILAIPYVRWRQQAARQSGPPIHLPPGFAGGRR